LDAEKKGVDRGMMGHKVTCKSGEDYDLLYAKSMYCYLQNNNRTVRYIKNRMIRRMRRQGKRWIKEREDE
jgi:hypothetical protein